MPGAALFDSLSVRQMLDHLGEPITPPRISPYRGPPPWEEKVEPVLLDEVVQPEPEYPVDQTASW